MKKARHGSILPAHQLIANIDPTFGEAYEELFELIMTRDRSLSVRTKELIVIGILAAKGQFSALDTHIHRAMKIGIGQKEILEALEVSMLYGGTESMIVGGELLAKG